ncbi:RHS repeat-associated core domain protein, partial [mine drainage metagenome]
WSDSAVQSSYGANDIIFCGYRYDPESQLYYVRNRTYSPVLGRWLQRDPIGYAGGVNLYEYVGGRAATAVDPTGLLRCVPCYQCQQTLDQEEAQAIQQIVQEAIGLGLPGSLTVWKIVGGTIVTASGVGLWGGIWGRIIGAAVGGVEVLGKLAELSGLLDQMNAEIQSDIAAYKNCMKNCSN